ncbi:MAG: anthranilate phosphoribosyltransferase, partial [Gammaproteobacteria bacterium]
MDSRVSEYLRHVARGKHGSRHLNMHEARDAMTRLLRADADPLQLGAFLIAERMKGETAAELAGFVQAVRELMPAWGMPAAPEHAVDLPCYAGKRRALPVHLLAAVQAARQGIPVCVHGVAEIEGRLSAWQALELFGVRRAGHLGEAAGILASDGIVYVDLADISPALFQLYGLRKRLGVRTCAHTLARLLNPLGCPGQLNGVFHPPYVAKMIEANVLLGQPRSLVFMGAEGEPELLATRQKLVASQTGDRVAAWRYAAADDVAAYPRDRLHV